MTDEEWPANHECYTPGCKGRTQTILCDDCFARGPEWPYDPSQITRDPDA